MKKIIILISLCFFYLSAISQSCLPEGIIFKTQTEIDSFQINYPSCTEIEGSVFINDDPNGNITNLAGLNVLSRIGTQLTIRDNDSLISLAGLENLDSIGLNLIIKSNKSLTSIACLGGLLYVEGIVIIEENNSLLNLEGLDNLDTIPLLNIIGNESLEHLHNLSNLKMVGSEFWIGNNQSLSNLSGLENLAYVGEDVKIFDNDLLTDLNGLNNLKYVQSIFKVRYNDQLSSLNGLDNLDTIYSGISINDNPVLSSMESIAETYTNLAFINNNPLLEVCNINSICRIVFNDPEDAEIYDNAPGCNSVEEVLEACSTSCLADGIVFQSQAQIDSFPINYPFCTEIEGNVTIRTMDNSSDCIKNLNGLDIITSIGGDLSVYNNDSLYDLSGLENLSYIGGSFSTANLYKIDSFWVYDNSYNLSSLEALSSLSYLDGDLKIWGTGLSDLSGLEGLDQLKGDLQIGRYYQFTNHKVEVGNNPNLKSLDGIENIASIGGGLLIEFNDSLVNIEALNDNIIADTLKVWINPQLSECDITVICNHLITGASYSLIDQNADGCNSPEEVIEECTYGVDEISDLNDLKIYPNPANQKIYFDYKNNNLIDEINIYTLLGKHVLRKQEVRSHIDISTLNKGMYIIEFIADQQRIKRKLIKN